LERNFLKQQLPQTLSLVHGGVYSPELIKLYEAAYKKRVLPPKEQQRKTQLRGSSSGSFALKIDKAIHEARQNALTPKRKSHVCTGTSDVARVAAGPR
jgi:hypothetical protein